MIVTISQNLDCREVATREFNCTATIESVWVKILDKETIDSFNQSENRGSQVSHGLSYQKLGKELMTQDELAVMDGGKCIFMLRGVRPFLSDKYDLTRHPNYRYTADADPKNVFDMERYMKKQRAVVKPTDTFDVYEIDATT